MLNDRRLLCCAELCVGERAADVGTDHGYLPVYLIEKGICSSAVACDINEMPLASARENIARAGLSDKIETVLSDGLDSVPEEGITDVVIAGMGGELIADIIARAEWIKTNRVNLILQPMTKWDHLRRFLHASGFNVIRELPCKEGRFVYSVMQAVYSGAGPEGECSLEYLYGGLVSGDTCEGAEYLERQAMRLEAVGRGIGRDAARSDEAEKYLSAAEALRAKISTE
ncbi:MAG: SAM-dependent methyltransferase [Ruminococcus sp.]|nr:SAM-dependent methyltransferase [Ruminococcus sp.]